MNFNTDSKLNLNLMNTNQITCQSFYFQHPLVKSFLFGSFSGTLSTLLFQPFDLLKTRLQKSKIKNLGLLSLSLKVIKDEKAIGLWKGTVPSLVRCVPGVGLYFCCLHALEHTFCALNADGQRVKPNAVQAIWFGFSSRCIVGALLMPATLIKTRLESGLFQYSNLIKAFSIIYYKEGFTGLYSGLSVTLMRDAPFSALYYMFYSQLNYLNSKKENKFIDSINNYLCGVLAGLFASCVTQPADVIKTRMQVKPLNHPKILLTILIIMKENGFKGFFAGMLPRMIRRTLMSSLAWTIYESFSKKFNLK